MGGLLGSLAGAFLNEYMTKKSLLLLSVILNMAGILMSIFANSLFLASSGLFINYAAKVIQMEVIPCIIT